MLKHYTPWLLSACLSGVGFLSPLESSAQESSLQVPRYAPDRPTVSPYLNLFRNESAAVPNYQTLVRPLQRQYEVNETQERILLQQTQAVQQLQSNVEILERQATGELVAPTGQGSWFGRASRRSMFLNTSRYYSQSGSLPVRR